MYDWLVKSGHGKFVTTDPLPIQISYSTNHADGGRNNS